MDEGDKSDSVSGLMLMPTKGGVIGWKRNEDLSSIPKTRLCLFENGDWVRRMLNNVAQENKIEFVLRRIDFQDIPQHKTELGVLFEGASPNAVLVYIKSNPAADACDLAHGLQHAAFVTPEVAHGQAGERDMRIKPRNDDISSDRVLVVKIREPLWEKLSPEEVRERSHGQRPAYFPRPEGSPGQPKQPALLISKRRQQAPVLRSEAGRNA